MKTRKDMTVKRTKNECDDSFIDSAGCLRREDKSSVARCDFDLKGKENGLVFFFFLIERTTIIIS